MTLSDDDLPKPPAVSAYLRSMQWELLEQGDARATFRKRVENDDVVIEIPLKGFAPDYPRRFRELLEDLQKVERRDSALLTRDIRTSTSDVLRMRLAAGTIPHGRISVEQGARVFQRSRDLLLAAACAAVEKRPVYSRKKFEKARDYLSRAHFAPTEGGSFIVVIESTVPPYIEPTQPDLFDTDHNMEGEPFNRAVGLTLARATLAARALVDRVSISQKAPPLGDAVAEGVSSNLCEAIADLVDPDQGTSLELSFRWAATRLPKTTVPSRVLFDSSSSQFLAEVARGLREASTIEDFELVGPIFKLASEAAGAGGEITVSMIEPYRGRKVRVRLAGHQYQDAMLAHGAEEWISVEGDLARTGDSFVLLNPRNLRTLPTGATAGDAP